MKLSPKDCTANNRWLKFFRKWHRWPGVIMGFFFILWAISGIILNHRQLFSGLTINRKYLPKEYRYVNWNNGAVKSAVKIGQDSLLFYGNIGIWLTDSSLSYFKDFNAGFPDGIDNRKISSMLVTASGNIYAGSLFGLYNYNSDQDRWTRLSLPVKDQRIQWLDVKGDKLMILTRSQLFIAEDDPENFTTEILHLQPPEGYDNKAGLFRTIWIIHSGEIYGTAGKIIVDILGLVVILLSITGVLHFSMPFALRYLKKKKRSLKEASITKRISSKWHKKAGIWIAFFLLINTLTGMFLRPPLLITIADARAGKIPWSALDTSNPWEDKLRAIIYDEKIEGYIFGTSEGLFYSTEDLSHEMIYFPGQPPLSVMGINVFRKTGYGAFLVGSFNGLYDWIPEDGYSRGHFSGEIAQNINTGNKPFGDEMVSGYWVSGSGQEVCFDYNLGAMRKGNNAQMPAMPAEILEKSPMSWWNFALEVHTGRIFKPLMAGFYILIIPLFGIFGTILVITGIVVWVKLYVRKNR
jgi:hypothetical protein